MFMPVQTDRETPMGSGGGQPAGPVFSIIVAGPSEPAALHETLASMLTLTAPAHEVIVVDTDTDAETTRVLRGFTVIDPSLRPLRAPGLTAKSARNAGALLARGPLLAFVTPGTRLRPDALTVWQQQMTAHGQPVAAVLGSPGCPADDGAAPTPLTPTALMREASPDPTAPLIISHAAWTRIGGFDETMHHAMVEDWLLRAISGNVGITLGASAPVSDGRPGSVAGSPPSLQTWDRLWTRAVAEDPDLWTRRHAVRARHRRALAVAARRDGAPRTLAFALLAQAVAEWPAMMSRETRATWRALRRVVGRG
ncbi:glycosyltransferase family 2 protein [Rhodospira trueperi]|uniref:Glycosyl transferase family 2 n=1 Tax=Rhodospira trueperi TaxID=69960 RepID=A0A1G7CP30_9PROT|nr:glycosyltransferase family A protein [Rhodospira trueperi]SDE41087.1 Glycosyl transferase family 2 [Rhodospira trueperi]